MSIVVPPVVQVTSIRSFLASSTLVKSHVAIVVLAELLVASVSATVREERSAVSLAATLRKFFAPQLDLLLLVPMVMQTVSMNPLLVSATHMCRGVGHCLVVKNGGGNHVFLAHLEHLDETGWRLWRLEFQT